MANVELRQLLRYNLYYWLSLSLCDAAFALIWLALDDKYPFHWQHFTGRTLMLLLEITMTYAFIRWSFARQLSQRRVMLAAAVVLCVYIPLQNFSWLVLKSAEEFNPLLLLSQLDLNSLPFFIWVLCYLTFWRYQQQQHKLQESARLNQNIQQLELQALQHQLNPHFTFNALNSVCALLEAERYDDAEVMSEQLSTFLRYSLSKSPDSLVQLADELSAIAAYLTLQKTRFGDKLKVVWQVDPSLSSQLIPALLLQPLVENAVKYAVAGRQQGATIRIESAQRDGQLQLEVADDGPGSSLAADARFSSGIGLANIRDRLQQHFGENASLVVHALPSGFRVNICLPWQGSL